MDDKFDTSEVSEVVAVVAEHARILEKHADALSETRTAVKRIEASLETVIGSQREMNQLLAAIHSMWARLECVRPGGRPPSSELRAVGIEES